jgi:hypothetical protein
MNVPGQDQYPDQDLSQNPVIQQQMQEQMLREFYRSQRRKLVLRAIVAVASLAGAAAICYHVFGPEAIIQFLEEYWPVLMAPFAGWFLGRWTVKMLYRPSGRMVVCMDPSTHLVRAVFIPDPMFRFFEQSGNNVLYHSSLGMPVYIAESIDTERGSISYSWIHELSSLEVMTREDTYNNWRATLEEVLRENLGLMDHPHVIGLGYARKCLKDQLDLIAETLGLTGKDFSRDYSVSSPEDGYGSETVKEDTSDERGHRLHQADGARAHHCRRLGEAGEVLFRPQPDSLLLA